jgi:hypothetical protein
MLVLVSLTSRKTLFYLHNETKLRPENTMAITNVNHAHATTWSGTDHRLKGFVVSGHQFMESVRPHIGNSNSRTGCNLLFDTEIVFLDGRHLGVR